MYDLSYNAYTATVIDLHRSQGVCVEIQRSTHEMTLPGRLDGCRGGG